MTAVRSIDSIAGIKIRIVGTGLALGLLASLATSGPAEALPKKCDFGLPCTNVPEVEDPTPPPPPPPPPDKCRFVLCLPEGDFPDKVADPGTTDPQPDEDGGNGDNGDGGNGDDSGDGDNGDGGNGDNGDGGNGDGGNGGNDDGGNGGNDGGGQVEQPDGGRDQGRTGRPQSGGIFGGFGQVAEDLSAEDQIEPVDLDDLGAIAETQQSGNPLLWILLAALAGGIAVAAALRARQRRTQR